jgi:hypothetical protein
MAGFVLPKFRWLVIGALAAGAWAVIQEPASKREQRAVPRPTVTQNVAKQTQRQVNKSTRSGALRQAQQPESRPSKLVTSSIKRPEKPATQPFYTTSRVRLREDASTAARVITWLKQGEKVAVLKTSGKWRRVVVAGRKGWVHSDYLQLPDPDAPRPQELVTKTSTSKAKEPILPASSKPLPAPSKPLPAFSLSKRPARPAQRGDCQCPYDLMINGKQCGDRSAYVMRGRASAQCYL